MIDKDFPCAKCVHPAKQHYVTVCGTEFVCVGCTQSTKLDWIDPDDDPMHQFVGDNLKFMELQSKRKDLLNEQL